MDIHNQILPNPLSRKGQDPKEVKAFREDFDAGRIPRPRCKHPGCECELTKWGCYYRTDARLADGTRLAPIPIPRFRCPVHGTMSWLPPFLNRYLRYIAEVVSQVLDDFARSQSPDLCDQPDGCTLGRWVRGLLATRNESWIHRRLEQAEPDWRSLMEPQPPKARPWAWLIVESARCLTRLVHAVSAQHLFSPFLQLARQFPD